MQAAGEAIRRGAGLSHADSINEALELARAGETDLILADRGVGIRDLVAAIDAMRLLTPVVACGPDGDACSAEMALAAGAAEYLPLPGDAARIASLLASLATDSSSAAGIRPPRYQAHNSQSA